MKSHKDKVAAIASKVKIDVLRGPVVPIRNEVRVVYPGKFGRGRAKDEADDPRYTLSFRQVLEIESQLRL